eukprot:TRINITY_DN2427_c0_g1_i1.p1 TRINITY_DN2427_c0_g1~~TRINITY_DN2427_c0_g1_i1.p1  ORF type:complete len:391 (-),score=35.41 TRINITY_DN2427_c0_g1_i1:36-1142(-)
MDRVIVAICLIFGIVNAQYSVSLERRNNGAPIISSQNSAGSYGASIFEWNYNTAYVPVFGGLMVRAQNHSTWDHNNPYAVAPSKLAYAQIAGNLLKTLDNVEVYPIDEQSVVVEPSNLATSYGTEDPRIAYDYSTGIYYLMYSAVENDTVNNAVIPRLALRTSRTPFVMSSWVDHGPIFPQLKVSKSGALYIRPNQTSYLYWGDSSLVNGMQLATTTDLINYNYMPDIWLPMRPDSFDSALVEAGPCPLPLSDGNLFFVYNSARHGYPSAKPDWDLQYNAGWVIINGSDPTQIIQRSDQPLLSPDLPWEIGTSPYLGLTPNVVFIEGIAPGQYPDTFIVFYGAADSYTGIAEVTVSVPGNGKASVQIN